MSLTRREKILLFFTSILVISMIGYRVIFEGYGARARQLDTILALDRLKLRKELSLLGRSRDIINRYRASSTSFNSVSDLLGYIENMAARHSIQAKKIQPFIVKDNVSVTVYRIRLQMEGEENNIASFIDLLSRPPARLYIEGFDFYAAQDSPRTIKCNLVFSAFFS